MLKLFFSTKTRTKTKLSFLSCDKWILNVWVQFILPFDSDEWYSILLRRHSTNFSHNTIFFSVVILSAHKTDKYFQRYLPLRQIAERFLEFLNIVLLSADTYENRSFYSVWAVLIYILKPYYDLILSPKRIRSKCKLFLFFILLIVYWGNSLLNSCIEHFI